MTPLEEVSPALATVSSFGVFMGQRKSRALGRGSLSYIAHLVSAWRCKLRYREAV